MKHINYKTRFKFHIAQSIGGSDVNWQDDWRAVFSTSGTNKGYEASYIGGAETNCEVKGDGTVTIFMNNYNLEPGVLTAVVYTRNTNGAWQNTATVNTGVELVGGSTDAPTDQDLQVLLPYVYIDAYTIAKENGYTGTQAEYVKLLGSLGSSFLSLKGGVVDGDVEVKNLKALEITTDIVNTNEIRTSLIALATGADSLTFDANQVIASNSFRAQKMGANELDVVNGTVGCMTASPFAVQVYGAFITKGLQAEGGDISGDFSFGSNVEVSGGLTVSENIRVNGIYSPNGTIDQLSAGELTTGIILGHNGQLVLSADDIILEGVNELNVGKVSASEGVIGTLTSNGYSTQVRGLLSANAISADSAEIGALNVGSISGITTLEGYGLWEKYTDLNDALMGMFFTASPSAANIPTERYSSGITLAYDKNNLYRSQIALSKGLVFHRQENDGVWGAWKELASTDSTVANALKIEDTALDDIYRISGWSSHLPHVYQNNISYYYWYKIAQLDLSIAANAICEIEVTTVNDVNIVGNASGTIVAKKYYVNGMQYSMSIAYVANSRTRSKINVALDSSGGIWIQAYKSEWGSYLAFRTRIIDNIYNAVEVKYYSRQIEQPENSQVIGDNQHIRYDFGTATFSSIGILTTTLGALEVQSQNLVTNLNANYLQGLNKDAFVQVGADITAPNITAKSLMIPSVMQADASGVNILCDSLHQGNVMLTYHADSLKGLHTSLMGEHAREGARYHLIGLQDNPDKCILSVGSKSYNPSGAVEEIVLQTVDNAGGIVLHGKVYVPERFKLGGATFTWDATNERVVCDKPIVTA